ncbi:glycosyltransferase family 2 protein [Lacinutrix jangbogonensis]|uniref:glycosyltransferase family 2 protein n=1 Tax=Lacinutrix jangbogonensis TaxID=1469557 RepID=UPI000691B4E8|nr:glycosyltransferase family 2 protein [Lacinutrix jangbogonensis]
MKNAKDKTPVLSIIIPTYNSASTLSATLDSILNQTFKDVELLIMDGLSIDKTLEIATRYQKQFDNVFVYSEKDKGVYDAMNKGIDLSKGDFLYFMGSDDVFYNNTVLANMLTKGNVLFDFIYGSVEFKKSKRIHSGESSFNKLVWEQISICHQAIFYSRETFDTIGYYNLKYFIHADYDFNIRCFKNKAIKIKYVDSIVAIFNEAGLSGLNSNADAFHTELTAFNVNQKYNILDLYNENLSLEKKIKSISNSKEYRLGQFLLKPIKKLKKMFF